MAQMSSGSVLKETRERKGYDLTTVARRLRIRPDILRAIEASDFSAMPPKGYTRNMVNAYARLLGLNPTEIVNMYLDEVYAYQVEKARGRSADSGFVMDPDNRRTRLRGNRANSDRTSRLETSYNDNQGTTEEIGRTGRMTRHLYDDRTQFSRDDYGVSRGNANGDTTERDFLSHHSGYSSASRNYIDNSRNSGRRGSRDIHVGQTPMEYKPSRLPSLLQSRLALGIAIAAVVILVFLIVFFVFLRPGQSNNDDVSQLPVSGISDTTGEDDEDSTASVDLTPTSAHVIFKAKSGQECYVETYVDGKIDNNYTLSGNDEKSVDVTGTWTITTWDKDALTVTVQGEEVELKTDDEYGGMYAYTLNFKTWLNDWLSKHGSSSSKREAAVANATDAANSAKSQKETDDDDATAAAVATGAAAAIGASAVDEIEQESADDYYYDYETYDYYDDDVYYDEYNYYDDASAYTDGYAGEGY